MPNELKKEYIRDGGVDQRMDGLSEAQLSNSSDNGR